MDENVRMVTWNFEPYNEVRKDMISEVVFVKRWQKLMLPERICLEQEPFGKASIRVDEWHVENESSSFPILEVITHPGSPTEHDTRIASNMIRWLGTNSGRDFLWHASNYMRQGIEPELAHLVAWNKVNIRDRSVNRGSVPRDSLTSSFEKVSRATSAHDLETLDQVAQWIGSKRGQEFIAGCDRNIEIKFDREQAARRAKRLQQHNLV